MLPEPYALSFQKQVIERIEAPDWSWEEACSMGIAARNYRDLSNWVIGTVALGIEKKWGEDRVGEFAKLLGFRRTTIQQYRWVVKKFGSDYNPTEGLPWTFYRIAAGTDDPQKTIAHIADRNLDFQAAERYVKGLPVPPDCSHDYQPLILERCIHCGQTRKMQEGGG